MMTGHQFGLIVCVAMIGILSAWLWRLKREATMLRKSEARLRAVMDSENKSRMLLEAVEQSPVTIVITNREGIIEYVNPNFTEVTGYSFDQAIGQKPSFLKSGDTPLVVYEDLWKTICAGKVWKHILHNCCKNGELIWEDVVVSPIVNEQNEIVNFVAVKKNVTEHIHLQQKLADHQAHLEQRVKQRTAELSKALEAAKFADRAKDEFLANVNHELRTPLNVIIGMSSLAKRLSSDSQQREYLDNIAHSGKTLAGIINDLLDLSKIVAGRLVFERFTFSLRQRVEYCRSVMGQKAEEKGLAFLVGIAEKVPDLLIGDPLRIEQILLNLLSNAVKFTASGQVKLRIGLAWRRKTRVCLNIEVEDSGIGLSTEEIDQLFKPFSQADASIARLFGGTGLGLAICKRLAQMMDGDINVSSEGTMGRGSTFHVKLVFELAEAEALPIIEEFIPVVYHETNVLVVDDQAFNRKVVKALLSTVSIASSMASNGREALELLRNGGPSAFDLVLMDIRMPVMDGLAATLELRKQKDFAKLPIIAMTAHTMTHEKEKYLAAGINDHIGKPFDENSFYRLIAKWIPRTKQKTQAIDSNPSTTPACFENLRGIDTKAGLSILNGDEVCYRNWLRQFVVEAPMAVLQIQLALEAEQPDQASMGAHTLKGRSGMLGMSEIHRLASELETTIDNHDSTENLLNKMQHSIDTICSEIKRVLGDLQEENPPSPLPPCQSPNEVPCQQPPESVARLLVLLETGNSNSLKVATACLDELKNTIWEPRLRSTLAFIKTYDFETAAAWLSNREQDLIQEGANHGEDRTVGR